MLDDVRGKVLFALDNEDSLRDSYREGHPALRGRLMFVSVAPTDPAAAWMKVNDAIGDFDRIVELIRGGFLVRTRADADTIESRKDDATRRDRALASGAQFISTDYPEPRLEFSKYQVRFDGGAAARANPVLTPGGRGPEDPEGPLIPAPRSIGWDLECYNGRVIHPVLAEEGRNGAGDCSWP